jgi:cysteinyl-tRNA synthetase
LKLYSTSTRSVEEFAPSGDQVLMYVCGPNLYDAAHLGHAMSYIIFDVLRRYLEFRGFRVKHVQNFTDIEDKIILRAQAQNTTIDALSEKYIDQFHKDMAALNVREAHEYPRATHEIPAIIEMVEKLIETGFAYETNQQSGKPANQAGNDVYFRVRKKADYGKLSGRNPDDLMAGARIEPGEQKEDPADFALWKGAKEGEPAWDSPWGKGRPGWHIECSAMSLRHLGETLDLHGGGQDLIFPHHENEIAQSEAYTGKQPFVRFWVHHGLMRLPDSEEKMTRSLGNLIPIYEALDNYGLDALRLFILGSHYRGPLAYSEESLESSKRAAERLRLAANVPGTPSGGAGPVDGGPFYERFLESMDDDLNTAGALAAMFDLSREINRGRDEGREIGEAQTTLRELSGVLGLTLEEPEAGQEAAPFVDLLVELRNEMRKEKLFAFSDKIRERLEELGIALEDGPEGTRWRVRE